jgi:hypothetical protein
VLAAIASYHLASGMPSNALLLCSILGEAQHRRKTLQDPADLLDSFPCMLSILKLTDVFFGKNQPRDLKSMQILRLWVIFWGARGFSTYIVVVCLHHWVFDSPHHSTWGTQLWPEHRLLGEHIDSYLAWPSPSKSEPSHGVQLPSDPFSSLQFSRARSISCISSLRKICPCLENIKNRGFSGTL